MFSWCTAFLTLKLHAGGWGSDYDGLDLKTIHSDVLGRNFLCLFHGPPGSADWWFSVPPVFQWCCLTPQRSPDVSRRCSVESASCFIVSFICDLFVARNDSSVTWRLPRGPKKYMFYHYGSWGRRLVSRKASFSPTAPQQFITDRSKAVQSTLVISTSLISNNRLSRSENLVPV